MKAQQWSFMLLGDFWLKIFNARHSKKIGNLPTTTGKLLVLFHTQKNMSRAASVVINTGPLFAAFFALLIY